MKTTQLNLTIATAQSIAQKVIEFVFYGNYFYGICAVSMMLETVIQLNLSLYDPMIYVMSFMATILFYNYPYVKRHSALSNNPRTKWFVRNHTFIIFNQVAFAIVLLLSILWLGNKYHQEINNLGGVRRMLLLVFPLTGVLYYGANFLPRQYNLRQIGWLKPFAIGLVWAGLTNVYPILYADLIHSQHTELSLIRIMLFLKTFMYVSMLALMFDIKDYETDSRTQLSTLVVKFGLRKTIYYIIIPLTILGLLTFISYALIHHFSMLKMILMMIPFFLLLASTGSFRKSRTLLYYLIVIDGLMIAKAFFGIIAMLV